MPLAPAPCRKCDSPLIYTLPEDICNSLKLLNAGASAGATEKCRKPTRNPLILLCRISAGEVPDHPPITPQDIRHPLGGCRCPKDESQAMSRQPDRRQVDAATKQLRAMEARWGVGRLRLLVDLDLATRFDRQRDKLRHAIAADDPILMLTHVTGMQRAWLALDAAATAAGAEPLAPTIWQCQLPASGKVVSIVRTAAEARAVDGEAWTLDEVAVLIERLGDDLRQVHAAFPGAELVEVRDRLTSQALDDEIPPAFLGGDRHRAGVRACRAARA